jgi:peptidyl-prolyl cis-trans isomerase SurA
MSLPILTRRLVLCLALLAGWPAAAQETRIAAVVNDDVISLVDLQQRIRLALVASNLPDDPAARQRVAPQVLRALVDEKLQLQEAKRLNVTVAERDIADEVARIEQQNRLAAGGLDGYLRDRGIDKATMLEQLRALIAWQKLLQRRMAQSISISPEEIDEAMTRLREAEGQPQSRVAEIFLAVDDPRQEDEVRRFAERLFEQMRQGAEFPALARQFSQSATAAVGGDIGWVTPGQLGGEIGQMMQRLQPGELSPPFRAAGGYYLILLIDRRIATRASPSEVAVSLVQVVFPLAPNASEADRQRMVERAQQATDAARSCGEMLRVGREQAPQTSGDLGRLRVGELPADLQQTVMTLPVAQPSRPIPVRGGIGVLMLCSREEPPSQLPSRDDIANMLTRQRLETMARRYLRDLRRTAFVELRV